MKLFWLRENNIRTCFWCKCNVEQCISYYNQYEKTLRAEVPYDRDGLCVKANSIKLQNELGLLGANPKAQIAWKFTSLKAETIIEGIEWSHGQNMRITPVALLKPTKIGGVIVRRASLHNMEMFHALNLGKGDKVLISRRNDVIPYIENVIEYVGNIKFKSPLSCPLCHEELVENDKFLMCENTECQGLRIGNLGKWVKALDVYDISDKTIELLERVGMLKDPSDFYKLDVNAISNLEGMGIRSATKIVENFKNKKSIDWVFQSFVNSN
jgi:DNA ligase (NAD+)